MTTLKSPRELAIMREAGLIVAECHAALAERVKPGVTTRELEAFVAEFLHRHGATSSCLGYHGFPGAICVSPNDVICHGIPGNDRLQEGDVITVDVMAYYRGYHGDSAWTYAVGEVTPAIRALMEHTHAALFAGIDKARAGSRLGDISHAVQAVAEQHGHGIVREFAGHGVGQNLHEGPELPHYGRAGTGMLLRPGLALAIEPMLTLGDWRARVEADGWTARTIDGSICVQYEHTVAITEEGPLVLTAL